MKRRSLLILLALSTYAVTGPFGQTQKPLTNTDIVNMAKQGFGSSLIVKDIQSSRTDFDTSPQALIDLKNAGVDQSVLEAMVSAQTKKTSSTVEAVPSATATAGSVAADLSQPACSSNTGCILLKEGTVVPLKFTADLSSKTANDGDSVELLLDDDVKVGDSVVVSKGAHAVATVSNVKKARMMGRPGDLAVQIHYLIAGSNHVRIRGTQAREGDSKTGATVTMTVLLGPIGLIKHGKNIEIPAGTSLIAYVDQEIWLPPIK